MDKIEISIHTIVALVRILTKNLYYLCTVYPAYMQGGRSCVSQKDTIEPSPRICI